MVHTTEKRMQMFQNIRPRTGIRNYPSSPLEACDQQASLTTGRAVTRETMPNDGNEQAMVPYDSMAGSHGHCWLQSQTWGTVWCTVLAT